MSAAAVIYARIARGAADVQQSCRYFRHVDQYMQIARTNESPNIIYAPYASQGRDATGGNLARQTSLNDLQKI
jgi:hypothetical protein